MNKHTLAMYKDRFNLAEIPDAPAAQPIIFLKNGKAFYNKKVKLICPNNLAIDQDSLSFQFEISRNIANLNLPNNFHEFSKREKDDLLDERPIIILQIDFIIKKGGKFIRLKITNNENPSDTLLTTSCNFQSHHMFLEFLYCIFKHFKCIYDFEDFLEIYPLCNINLHEFRNIISQTSKTNKLTNILDHKRLFNKIVCAEKSIELELDFVYSYDKRELVGRYDDLYYNCFTKLALRTLMFTKRHKRSNQDKQNILITSLDADLFFTLLFQFKLISYIKINQEPDNKEQEDKTYRRIQIEAMSYKAKIIEDRSKMLTERTEELLENYQSKFEAKDYKSKNISDNLKKPIEYLEDDVVDEIEKYSPCSDLKCEEKIVELSGVEILDNLVNDFIKYHQNIKELGQQTLF